MTNEKLEGYIEALRDIREHADFMAQECVCNEDIAELYRNLADDLEDQL